jgi:methyl-accepting chemotaxis protein
MQTAGLPIDELEGRDRVNLRTLKGKIFGLILGFVACYAATSFVLVQEFSHQAGQSEKFAASQLAIQNEARVIQLDFKKQVQSWKDILLRGADPASLEKYKNEFFEREAEVQRSVQDLSGKLSDAEIKDRLRKFATSHAAMGADYRAGLAAFERSHGHDFHGADSMVKGKDRPVTDAMDGIVAAIAVRAAQYQSVQRARAETERRSMLGIAFAIAFALFALGTRTARTINRSTFQLLEFLSAQAGELRQGRGDLSRRLASSSADEFGEISRAFDTYAEALEKIVSKLAQCSEQISSAGHEISAGADQSAESGRRQADQAAQVAGAMQEMSATVQAVSGDSQSASESAAKALQAAQKGGQVVKETIAAMQGIAAASRSSVERIAQLGKSSEQIGRITAVIDDIADQTNLLALNAAIEAAHAGEQGRGFAVVADEVRKLAERTSSATKEIAAMVSGIQTGTSGALNAMEQGNEKVAAGVEMASTSGRALDEIIQLAGQVGSLVSSIATATVEQTKFAATVNASISEISSLTHESSVASAQTATACTSLSDMASELEQIVHGFQKRGLETKKRSAAAGAGG